jgi:hypothetical protein
VKRGEGGEEDGAFTCCTMNGAKEVENATQTPHEPCVCACVCVCVCLVVGGREGKVKKGQKGRRGWGREVLSPATE